MKEDRTREVLTVVNFPTESATNWKDVFEDLKERGGAVVDLQLCTVHLKRSIVNKVKPGNKKQVMEELKQIYSPDQWKITPEKAFEYFKEFVQR